MFPSHPNYETRMVQDRFRHLEALEAAKKPSRLTTTFRSLRNRMAQRK